MSFTMLDYNDLKKAFDAAIDAYVTHRKETSAAKDESQISRAHQVALLKETAKLIDGCNNENDKAAALYGLIYVFKGMLDQEYSFSKELRDALAKVFDTNNTKINPEHSQLSTFAEALRTIVHNDCFLDGDAAKGIPDTSVLNNIDGVGASKEHRGTRLQNFLLAIDKLFFDSERHVLDAEEKNSSTSITNAFKPTKVDKSTGITSSLLGVFGGSSSSVPPAAPPASPNAKQP